MGAIAEYQAPNLHASFCIPTQRWYEFARDLAIHSSTNLVRYVPCFGFPLDCLLAPALYWNRNGANRHNTER